MHYPKDPTAVALLLEFTEFGENKYIRIFECPAYQRKSTWTVAVVTTSESNRNEVIANVINNPAVSLINKPIPELLKIRDLIWAGMDKLNDLTEEVEGRSEYTNEFNPHQTITKDDDEIKITDIGDRYIELWQKSNEYKALLNSGIYNYFEANESGIGSGPFEILQELESVIYDNIVAKTALETKAIPLIDNWLEMENKRGTNLKGAEAIKTNDNKITFAPPGSGGIELVHVYPYTFMHMRTKLGLDPHN